MVYEIYLDGVASYKKLYDNELLTIGKYILDKSILPYVFEAKLAIGSLWKVVIAAVCDIIWCLGNELIFFRVLRRLSFLLKL